MSYLWDAVESLKRIRVVPPMPCDKAASYSVEYGHLVGPGTFYVPTSTKFYRRPALWVGRPVGIILHYTGCHASNRDIKDFVKLENAADGQLDDSEGAIKALKESCADVGYIPDAVSLCLQNAGKDRQASWCLLIGSQPLPDGQLPVAQYSPDMDTCGTMHGGSPDVLWKAKKVYGDRPFKTTRGETRWTGRDYAWPEVELPDKSGKTLVIRNVNSYTIGIECMNLGSYGLAQKLKYPGLPELKIDKRTYEEPSDLMLNTLKNVISALRTKYGHIPVWGHCDLTPNKADPWPPFPNDL